MKFKRKPVHRDIVDALRVEQHGMGEDGEAKVSVFYIVQDAGGKVEHIPAEQFEAEYEPVKRERSPAPTRKRTKKPPVAAVA